MKKILFIIFLGLLLSENAYAGTINQEIINKKIYEEYSTCTVYFKFLSIAKEKQGKYKKKISEKDFLERMQKFLKYLQNKKYYFQKLLLISAYVQENLFHLSSSCIFLVFLSQYSKI